MCAFPIQNDENLSLFNNHDEMNENRFENTVYIYFKYFILYFYSG